DRELALEDVHAMLTIRLELVTPWKRRRRTAARCVLPLRFGRQLRTRPRAICLRIVPRHVHDRMIEAIVACGLRSFRMTPVSAVDLPPPGRISYCTGLREIVR